jgi:histidyl-tRNA synthetase
MNDSKHDSQQTSKKTFRPKARVAKGFRDISPDEIRGTRAMLATIQKVYESYGFEPVEQPFIEYTEALGKFLPDQDRPNAGVFSFQDDDEQWLSLRYDLTAPLARYVAENAQKLPTPYRSYRQGWVFRNEKPGPGRYRQFMQFDADTVGSASPAADAEVCMMAADTMEALGIPRGSYVIKVNHRKLLDALMQILGLELPDIDGTRMIILRAMDKFDKLGEEGVRLLLGKGRKDASGDFTKGAGMDDASAQVVIEFLNNTIHSNSGAVVRARNTTDLKEMKGGVLARNPGTLHYNGVNLYEHPLAIEALRELDQMRLLFETAGYDSDRIKLDSSIIRGLEYYTGPVFECELLMDTKDEDGNTVRFGSVGGGGRYDDLVARFTGAQVPATGFSIGVSRLYAALQHLNLNKTSDTLAPVIVLVMDKERQGDYWRMVQQLRAADIRAEMYVGTAGMKAQMKYADKRGSPLVVIQGGDEKANAQVQIKDLRLGTELAANIESREEYASQRLAQVMVAEADLVAEVRKMLAR